MKKILSLGLALVLVLTALAGCTGKNGGENTKTPEQLNELYATAITENGGEMAEYNAPVSGAASAEESAMWLELMGLTAEDTAAFAISTSMMMVHAYGIAAVMPAEGKAEAVTAGLQSFIERQQQAFERYLPDQYEIAKNAKLETLADGTVLMVMTADQDTVFEAIKAAIEA